MSSDMTLSLPGSYPLDDFDDGASDHSSEHSEAYFLAPEQPEVSFFDQYKRLLQLQARQIHQSSSTDSHSCLSSTIPVTIERSSISIYAEPSKEELIRRSEVQKIRNAEKKQYRYKRQHRTSEAANSTRLSLLSFPGEIRNRIYSYLFGGGILKLDYKPLGYKGYKPRPRMLRFGLNLLLTCYTIEKEICDYIFDICTFSFFSDQAVWKFAGMVQEVNVARIQKLHIEVPLFYHTDIRRWGELFEKIVLKQFVGLKRIEIDLQPRREVWVGRGFIALQEWISALKPVAAIVSAVSVNSGNMQLYRKEEDIRQQDRKLWQEMITRALHDEAAQMRA